MLHINKTKNKPSLKYMRGSLVTSDEIFGDIWYIPKGNTRAIKIDVLNSEFIFKRLIKSVSQTVFDKIPSYKISTQTKKVPVAKNYIGRIIKVDGKQQLWYIIPDGCYRKKIDPIDLFNIAKRMAKVVSPEIINNILNQHGE